MAAMHCHVHLSGTSNYTTDKNVFNFRGVGMANELTESTQTSVWMAQHNERTRLHDLLCTPTQAMHALVLFVHCVEPSAHLFVCFL